MPGGPPCAPTPVSGSRSTTIPRRSGSSGPSGGCSTSRTTSASTSIGRCCAATRPRRASSAWTSGASASWRCCTSACGRRGRRWRATTRASPGSGDTTRCGLSSSRCWTCWPSAPPRWCGPSGCRCRFPSGCMPATRGTRRWPPSARAAPTSRPRSGKARGGTRPTGATSSSSRSPSRRRTTHPPPSTATTPSRPSCSTGSRRAPPATLHPPASATSITSATAHTCCCSS